MSDIPCQESGGEGRGERGALNAFFFWYIKLTFGKACLGGRAITDSNPLYVSAAEGSVLKTFIIFPDFYGLS